MTEFLLFTIYAPLMSWGDIAVGELRGSWDRPSRSAILGLLAAGLGIDRSDQAGHDALEAGYGLAVRVDCAGTAMTDYHTAQTMRQSVIQSVVKKLGGQPPRAAILDPEPILEKSTFPPETMLSRRTYRQDALASIALWVRAAAPVYTLERLAEALRHPVFVLYAGRKANPLGLPLSPRIVAATSLAGAFAELPTFPSILEWPRGAPQPTASAEITHDPCDGFETGLQPLRREVRRDGAPQRTRWQFAERVVEVGVVARMEER